MRTKTMIVAGPEREYMERLVKYTLRPDVNGRWKIKSFTAKEHVDKWSATEGTCDVLAVDSRWVESGEWLAPEGAVLLHPTKAKSAEIGGRTWKVVHKYQPVPQLLNELAEAGTGHAGATAVKLTRQDSVCDMIALYSPVGGSGKTTVAMHLLKNVWPREEKVLYVNLELFQAFHGFENDPDKDVSGEWLYRLKAGYEGVEELLDKAVRYNAECGCYYLPPFWHVKNRLELGGPETDKLLQLLMKSGRFNRIVVDLDSSPHDSTFAALARSNRIIWLLLDDVRCVSKTKLALSAYRSWAKREQPDLIQSRCDFILNKYTGDQVNDYADIEVEFSGTLPYIPQWKSVRDPRQCLRAGVFSQSLARLFVAGSSGREDRENERTGTD